MSKETIKEYVIKVTTEGGKLTFKQLSSLDKIEKAQNKNLKETNSLLWTYAKRLVGIYAIYKMINKGVGLAINFAEQGTALRNLSTIANTSTKSLQKWGNVLRKFGGSEQSAGKVIGDINRKLYSRRFGIEPFQEYIERYGALPKGASAEEFLLNVAKRMEGVRDKQKKLDMAEKLNLDAPMTEFLLQGYEKVKQQLAGAESIFSNEDIERATKAKEELIAFNIQLEKLAHTLGGIALEPLTSVIKELTDFLKNPKQYIASATKSETGAFGVAKSMFDVKNIAQWSWRRILGLQEYSATTAKSKYLGGIDYLSQSIFGKDYKGAMGLFGGIGAGLYAGAGQHLGKGLNVYNDIVMNIGENESVEKVASEVSNKFDKAKEIVISNYKEATGAK